MTDCSDNVRTPSCVVALTASASTSADCAGSRWVSIDVSCIPLFHHVGAVGHPGRSREAVSHVAGGAEQGLPLGPRLGPETPDVDIHGAWAAVVVAAPDLGEQLLAGHHPAGMAGQVLQQLELLERQVQRFAAGPDRPVALVDN